MTNSTWAAVDHFVEASLRLSDPILEAALLDSAAAGLPAIAVSPAQGRLLHLLCLAIGARRVLEIGTLGGYSAICLGRALPSDGRLISLELQPEHAAVARANLARAGLSDRVEVIEGRASDTLARFQAESMPPFDLVFIDADKPSYPDYLRRALELTRPGGLIIADNVVRGGALIDPDNPDPMVRGVREFIQLLEAEPRLRATVVQTVGSKGYDGFAIGVVLAPSGPGQRDR